jgi:hypothetical protein
MAKTPVQPVVKPYLSGSWHGRDATKKGQKLILSILFISFLYLLLGVLINFNSLALHIATSAVIVALAAMYMFFQGANSGEADTAFAEILYEHEKDGKTIVPGDRERCFHPAKGFYIVLIGLIPYLLVTLLFAFLAQPILYALGVLPDWLSGVSQQTHVAEALAYYNLQDTPMFIPILRIIVRAMTMPFINVSLSLGTMGVLWAERLSPLWVMIAPLAYAFGYLQGPRLRIRVNTGIAIGLRNKRRKQRRERKARSTQKPQQLI